MGLHDSKAGGGSGWDFIQSTQPANPTEDGKTWLHTGRWEGFVWNNTQSDWLSIGTQHLDFTSAEGDYDGPTGALVKFAWIHDMRTSGTGGSWRPARSGVIIHGEINAIETPTSGDHLEIHVNGGGADDTIVWDGTNKWETKDDMYVTWDGFDVTDPGNSDRVYFKWNVADASDYTAAQYFRGTIHYKERIPGL